MLKNYLFNLNYKSILLLILIYSFIAILIISKGVYLLPFFLLLILGYCIIYQYPTAAILGLMLILYPTVFQMIPSYNQGYSTIYGGVRAEDIVLALMVLAVFQKIFIAKPAYNKTGLEKIIIIFFLLMFFNILRNIGEYGISSFGEFRFSYLILVLPIYISLFFNTPELRKKLFLSIILVSILAILLSVPIIVALKGWAIGTENDRFLSSQITLGLIYAVLALILSSKYNLINVPRLIILIITIPSFILLIADSHRSVWLALVIACLSLYLLKELKIKKLLKWSLWILILIIIVYLVFTKINLNLFDYIKERLIAFINPSEDPTSFWRILIWDASFKNFLKSPLFGQGFGAYWNTFVPELNQTFNLPPHNLYIHTIVKIGLVGLVLYLIIVFKLYQKLISLLSLLRKKQSSEIPIVIFSIVALVSSQFYYLVYSFDYFSMLYIGLGVSLILNHNFNHAAE